jgi:hypothetical protein
MECLDEAASRVAAGRASVAGKTAVDGVAPSAAIQAAAPTLCKGVTIYLLSYILSCPFTVHLTMLSVAQNTEYPIRWTANRMDLGE